MISTEQSKLSNLKWYKSPQIACFSVREIILQYALRETDYGQIICTRYSDFSMPVTDNLISLGNAGGN